MSIGQKLKSFFSTQTETRENHIDEQLKSRYYKTTTKKAIEAIKTVIHQEDGLTVKSVSEEHGEIAVEVRKGKKAFMIITVISVRPFETAIDFSVTTETVLPSDFGYSRKLIFIMYEKLGKQLTYVGSGLNAEK
ncbi:MULTISPECIES: cytosolic protein [Sutcliffiella]|uniref:cytosolic protein n=1 Tax=Sutcliffiella TaxID=2837511 RepID=UPI0022DD30EE|nr:MULTISPECIES: cytosolic protein [Sutcliffiella]MED4016234.1 cytosolic protein [Sutcliffiella cohnii]WBL14073.1 cytosolic protein [Sutcliffiella sp. NC1]